MVSDRHELADRIAALEAELLEQARIVGAGGERELALLAKVERLEAQLREAAGGKAMTAEQQGVKLMRKYITGFVVGLALGTVAPVAAASIVGSTGYLSGWIVTKDGREVCYMPYVWTALREIECD